MYFFFFKQKTAYEMRISDWSSDVCSSDLHAGGNEGTQGARRGDNGGGQLWIVSRSQHFRHRNAAHGRRRGHAGSRRGGKPGARELRRDGKAAGQERARKSTRLNSSH